MNPLTHGRSLRHKLNSIVVAATVLALGLSAVALLVFDLRNQARGLAQDIAAQTDIVALASSAAVAFDDAKAAAENLRAFRANPDVAVAALYSEHGRLVASYVADGVAVVPPRAAPIAPLPSALDSQWIHVWRPVTLNRSVIGSVYVQSHHNLGLRALEYLAVLAVVLAISLAAALVLAGRLQREVTQPLVGLSEVAQRIMRGDFSLRAHKSSDDEAGDLVDAFNAMVDELARRAETLEHANTALRAGEERYQQAEVVLRDANRTKDEFIATLAHELRNPLAPIRTGLEILKLDRANGPASARARETMERQLLHMIRLIDDLLDISRITSGKIRLETARIDLRGVVENALDIARPALVAGGHEVEVEVPPEPVMLDGDATRLSQAVGNLLNNAAKYTPPGGRVAVSVWREDGTAVIEVRDNGVGIPAEMLENVFTMFAQVNRTLDRAQGGLGIGLSLVRSLVQLHGGGVAAESPGAGQGSTFTIRLPCAAAARPADAAILPDAASTACAKGLKVLVVDDNVDAADTLAAVLAMMDMETRTVHSGREVLAAAGEFEPHCVLLDIGLPGMNGYEVAKQLRADPRCAGMTLIAVTGWGAEGDRKRAREAGFDHHLTKPVDIDALMPLLRAIAPA